MWQHSSKLKVKVSTFVSCPIAGKPATKAFRYHNALSMDYTVLPATHAFCPLTEWTVPAFAFPSRSWSLFTDPEGMKGRTVNTQSARTIMHQLFWPHANIQIDMPHWANRCKQLAHCCWLEWQCLESNSSPELRFDTLTTTPPSHPVRDVAKMLGFCNAEG